MTMETLETLRRRTGASLCLECGKCSALCPLASIGEFAARRVTRQDPHEGLLEQAEEVHRCLTCASCEERCPQGIRFVEFVRGIREMIPPERRPPCPHGGVIQSAARLSGDAAGRSRRLDWVPDDARVATEGEVGLFVGCLPVFQEVFGEDLEIDLLDIARSAVRLLNEQGVTPVVLAGERCCGHDLLWSGDRAAFEGLARSNVAAFAERRVRRLITTCAECCRTWRLDYPDVAPEYRPTVEHISEFLARRIETDGSPSRRPPDETTVTYQDPCRLGRHLGVFDPPREVLRALAGVRIAEMDRTERDALCCGTAGFIHCDAASKRLQESRLRTAAATGAEALVTACPKCLVHFRCAQADARRTGGLSPGLEVVDLTVFADRRVHPEAPRPACAGG
jgi:Fe-S oxidoreductase